MHTYRSKLSVLIKERFSSITSGTASGTNQIWSSGQLIPALLTNLRRASTACALCIATRSKCTFFRNVFHQTLSSAWDWRWGRLLMWKPQKPIWSKAAKFGKFTNGRWGDLFDWEFSPEPPTAKSGNPILAAIHSIPPAPRKAPGKKPNTITGNRKLFSIFEKETSHKTPTLTSALPVNLACKKHTN